MKFRVEVDCEAIGHLRYGHLEGVIEADSNDNAREALNSRKVLSTLDFVLDDYELDDYYPDGEIHIQPIDEEGEE